MVGGGADTGAGGAIVFHLEAASYRSLLFLDHRVSILKDRKCSVGNVKVTTDDSVHG